MPEGIERLTDRERGYLRLVFQSMSSKEIARRFGVEPGTVDKGLANAMAKLGASSRHVAALILAEAEANEDARVELACQPTALAGSASAAIMKPSNSDADRVLHEPAPALREEQTPYQATPQKLGGVKLPIRFQAGDGNDLTTWQSLGWIAVIAVGVPLLLGSLMLGLWALGQVGYAVRLHLLNH